MNDPAGLPEPTLPDPGRPEHSPTPRAAYVIGLALMILGFLLMSLILWAALGSPL